jgi:zinc protease
VASLLREDVAAEWERLYAPSRVTVVLAGDVTAERAVEFATLLCNDWPTPEPAPPNAVTEARHEGATVHLVHKPDSAQCELRVGHLAVPRSHPDYFPLTVMNAILGGLFSSRINLNLRERHGYTYGAHSGFDWRAGAGPFVVTTAVNTDAAGAATREVLSEIARIRTENVSADELSLATSYLAGVFPLRFETTSAVAAALVMQETFGLDERYFDDYRDAIMAVTRDEVRRVAHDHLHPERLQVVAVGDKGALTGQLEQLGLGPPATYGAEEIEAAP